jgi:hypothetical protein
LFPSFEIFGVEIYTFWITLTVCFFAFLRMLKKLSIRFHYDFSIFTKNLIWFFLSTFIFSRVFYIISRWTDLKYIKNAYEFFISSDYDFSLYWAVFWFLLVLFIILSIKKESFDKYFDWLMLSFLFVLFIWFVWAFLWWQVEWTETNLWIEVYNSYRSNLVFPLAIVYSGLFFLIFSVLYISAVFVNIRTFIWYVGTFLICTIFISFEFLNSSFDIVKDNYWINFTQLLSIILMLYMAFRLIVISKFFSKKEKIIIN